jgi:CheY-like chemotaxis protein
MIAQQPTNASRGRLLLVDDEAGFLYAAEKALRDAGFEVKAASDYQKALDILAGDEQLDLLLTDVVMPKGINGFALARMARMRRLNLKVLYTTAFDVPAHEAIGKILHKPISEAALVDEVTHALAA